MSGKDISFESRVMSTLYNPFSIKNLDPKWPDGLCPSSKGVQLKRTSEIVGTEVLLVLIPGLVNWCFAYQWIEENNDYVLLLNHCDNQFVLNFLQQTPGKGATDQNINAGGVGLGGKDNPPEGVYTDELVDFSSWRGVSYGMRLMNVNTDHDNDGWFECIRTSRNVFLNRLGIAVAGDFIPGPSPEAVVPLGPYRYNHSVGDFEHNNVYLKPGCVFPLEHTAQEWFSARNWALMPSYASGKLKELKDFVFQLNPEKNINKFTDIKYLPVDFFESVSDGYYPTVRGIFLRQRNFVGDSYVETDVALDKWLVLGMKTEYQDGGGAAPTATDFEYWTDFHQGFTSDNFDIILVKLHGLENTRTVVSSVANYEFQNNERKTFRHHMHTNSYACPDALEKYVESRVTYHRSPFRDVTKNKR